MKKLAPKKQMWAYVACAICIIAGFYLVLLGISQIQFDYSRAMLAGFGTADWIVPVIEIITGTILAISALGINSIPLHQTGRGGRHERTILRPKN